MDLERSLVIGLTALGDKPMDTAGQVTKKRYSEGMSAAIALSIGAALRDRGMLESRPAEPGEFDASGAERRLAGGIGAKKVDVTWATAESGLLLGCSIKTINFRDVKTRNFQKNLTNRRSDMLFEAVTLHRRFPYAVLGGFFFLDAGAEHDGTEQRESTFLNAHRALRLFTGRNDPAGRDEQFEHLFVGLVQASSAEATVRMFRVGVPDQPIRVTDAVEDLCRTTAERNPDFYAWVGSKIHSGQRSRRHAH